MSKRFRVQFPYSFKDEHLFQAIKSKIVKDGLVQTSKKLGLIDGESKDSEAIDSDILSGRYTIYELSSRHDVSVSVIEEAIESLMGEGCYNLVITKQGAVSISTVIDKKPPTKIEIDESGSFLFGAIGDNHLGSKYEDLEALNTMYDKFQEAGVKSVFNTGNWIDGERRFNKNDLHTHGFDNQLRYMIENYPQRDGVTTHYIAGDDHEGWYTQDMGIDVGRRLEQDARSAGRTDLINLGYMESTVHIDTGTDRPLSVCVMHPGGGSAYALSHTTQKIVESFSDSEKPDVLLIGHYHKASNFLYKGVNVIQTGCTQGRTPFMKKKRLSAHIGGYIVKGTVDSSGDISSFTTTFYPLSKGKWEYQW